MVCCVFLGILGMCCTRVCSKSCVVYQVLRVVPAQECVFKSHRASSAVQCTYTVDRVWQSEHADNIQRTLLYVPIKAVESREASINRVAKAAVVVREVL